MKHTTSIRKLWLLSIEASTALLLIFAVLNFVYPPQPSSAIGNNCDGFDSSTPCDENAVILTTNISASSMSIAIEPSVNINSLNNDNRISSNHATAVVTTDSSFGYTLYVNSDSSDLVNESDASYQFTGIGNTTDFLSGTGTMHNPIKLTKQTVGFAVPRTQTGELSSTIFFDNTYTTEEAEPLATSTSHWAKIPTQLTAIKIVAEEATTTADTNTDIWFGINSSSDLVVGAYTTAVYVTAVANIEPAPIGDGIIGQIDRWVYSDAARFPEGNTIPNPDNPVNTIKNQLTINGTTYDVDVKYIKQDCVYDTQALRDCDGDGIDDFITTTNGPMLIRVYYGNLTINSGITITPILAAGTDDYTARTKGLTIYVKGTLTNNGTISMTARGATAPGQNVYLWKDIAEIPSFTPCATERTGQSWCYVPAAGAASRPVLNGPATGTTGIAGAVRQTGGGGTGGATYSASYKSGASGAGTSYSGGTGSGGMADSGTGTSGAGVANGGSGGAAGGGSSTGYGAGGGAGNPGGAGSGTNGKVGNSGTGGLLIVYAYDISNSGNIVSNGSNGGAGTGGTRAAGGGGSGGGSVNIFYRGTIVTGTRTATGGSAGAGTTVSGGAGGAGFVSTTQIPVY